MSDKKYSRREIIQLSGMTGLSIESGMDSLISMIVKSFIKNAAAEEVGIPPSTNYINFGLLGAPLRFQFDHWIRTNATDPELQLSLITGTKYTKKNNKIDGIENGYFNHNGVLVPHLFSQNVDISSGSKPLADLLKHMVSIRGFGTGLDGHPTNMTRQMAPVGGLPSTTGLAADAGSKVFDAIQWPARGTYGVFTSAKGRSLNVLRSSSSPALELLEGFAKPPANLASARNLTERNKDAVDLVKRRLGAYINAELPGSKILAKNHSNAIAMIKKGTDNLASYWQPAVDRYKRITDNGMRALNIPGISDFPLVFDPNTIWSPLFESSIDPESARRRNELLWKMGSGTSVNLNLDFDLRTAVAQASIPALPETLALCEYVLTEGLGSALEIHIGNIPLKIMKLGQNAIVDFQQDMDMHELGAGAAVFVMNQFYRSICAGLMELIDCLRTKKIGNTDVWANTLIQFNSEFERSCRPQGTGSDHGYNQMVTSVISGTVTNGPHAVGNVLTSLASGTQGIAAPIDGYNQKGMPNPTMPASTVAALMKVEENPFANLAEPLCDFENGVLKIKYPGKLIVGG